MEPGLQAAQQRKREEAVGNAWDDVGWGIAKDPVHVNDLHATMLHQFGLDHLKLTHRFLGRDFRLTDVSGNVITPILA